MESARKTFKKYWDDVRVNLKGNPLKQFSFVVVLMIGLVVTVSLAQVAVRYFTRGQVSSPQIFFSPGSTSMPPNTSVKLMMNANGNSVGAVRVTINFNNSLVNLANEINTNGPMSTVVVKTSRVEANSTGKIVLVLALPPSSRDNPPTTTFELATIPLTVVTSQSNTGTSFNIGTQSVDTRVADFSPQFLPFTTSNLSLTLNSTTATNTPSLSSPTPPSGNSANFTIKFQGVPPATGFNLSTENVNVVLGQGGSAVNTYSSVTTFPDNQGIYVGQIAGFNAGTYDFSVKGAAHLRRKFSGISLVSGANSINLTGQVIKAGDFDNNNNINIIDISLILSQYTALSVPINSLNQNYDINNDGVINIVDISIVLGNYLALNNPGDSF